MYHFEPYERTATTPNVVVDGAANAATVLTLSHWPGAATPAALRRDLSAEIAFAYLDAPVAHDPASIVTNNHFDQDGLVSVLALVDPDRALAHRELLIDLARAGDFATCTDRRAARASMVVARWADADLGYEAALARVLDLVLDPEPHRADWEAEDAHLRASEDAFASGRIAIEEVADVDLAVVHVSDPALVGTAHRFAHDTIAGVHPMAVHGATDRFRLLVLGGDTPCYVDRYETWVQYQSRPTLPRRDLRPLAQRLSGDDDVEWTADDPDALTPTLRPLGPTRLSDATFRDLVVAALRGEV